MAKRGRKPLKISDIPRKEFKLLTEAYPAGASAEEVAATGGMRVGQALLRLRKVYGKQFDAIKFFSNFNRSLSQLADASGLSGEERDKHRRQLEKAVWLHALKKDRAPLKKSYDKLPKNQRLRLSKLLMRLNPKLKKDRPAKARISLPNFKLIEAVTWKYPDGSGFKKIGELQDPPVSRQRVEQVFKDTWSGKKEREVAKRVHLLNQRFNDAAARNAGEGESTESVRVELERAVLAYALAKRKFVAARKSGDVDARRNAEGEKLEAAKALYAFYHFAGGNIFKSPFQKVLRSLKIDFRPGVEEYDRAKKDSDFGWTSKGAKSRVRRLILTENHPSHEGYWQSVTPKVRDWKFGLPGKELYTRDDALVKKMRNLYLSINRRKVRGKPFEGRGTWKRWLDTNVGVCPVDLQSPATQRVYARIIGERAPLGSGKKREKK